MHGGLGGLNGAMEIPHLVSRQVVVDVGGKGIGDDQPHFRVYWTHHIGKRQKDLFTPLYGGLKKT
jgi:hypothetical protein